MVTATIIIVIIIIIISITIISTHGLLSSPSSFSWALKGRQRTMT
jgi:hypothetical protein